MPFFSNGFGHCLGNKPRNNHLNVKNNNEIKYAGEFFDSNAQCELVFGTGSATCSYMPSCTRLWCSTPGGEEHGCKTQHMPWADGTPCGEGKWCIRSQCVSKQGQKAWKQIDGGWGDWKSWSSCSRSCGGGIRKSVRECDNPAPSRGGFYCIGDRVRYQSCNTQQCPPGGADFRQEQCGAFNGVSHNISDLPAHVNWVAKYTDLIESDKCKLYCRVEYSTAYYLLSSTVTDGTPCTVDGYDMCVAGQCVQAGCDHILGSNSRLDKCGVCGGDGASCVFKSGFFNSSNYGYNFAVKIPAGASNIIIKQKGWRSARDDNYISLKDSVSGKYIVNGGFTISRYKSHINFGNVILEYTGSDVVDEVISCQKPIPRDITVEIISVAVENYPQVSYSYWISTKTYVQNRRRNRKYKAFKTRKRRHKKLEGFNKQRRKIRKYAWKVGRWSKVREATLVTVKYDK